MVMERAQSQREDSGMLLRARAGGPAVQRTVGGAEPRAERR